MAEELKFNSPEEEIKYLEGKILEKKHEIGERTSHEVVREVIQEHSQTDFSSQQPRNTQQPSSDDSTDNTEEVVSQLIESAFSEGVIDAIKHVRDTHDPHLIDAFHDALTDRFVGDLKSRGLIEPHG